MEAKLKRQMAISNVMKTFIVNHKKAGLIRRTSTFYQKQLLSFENYWLEFHETHLEIISDADLNQFEKHDYFAKDLFNEMQSFFYENYDMIEQRFKLDYPEPKTIPTTSTSRPSVDVPTPNLKLPKVSLPVFDGNYRDWPTFHDLFETMIHNNMSLASVQKLQYLKVHLEGEPEHLLRHFRVTEKNYEAAWLSLKDRYQNKKILVNHELTTLFSQPNISVDSADAIKGLLDTTSECLQALSNMDVDISNWDPIIVYITVQKLSKESHQLWEQETSRDKELASWQTLNDFLISRFRTLEAVATKESSLSSSNTKASSSKSFYAQSKLSCLKCKGDHSIRNCDEFAKMDQGQRLAFVKTSALCINCLGGNHFAKDCPSTRGCNKCGQHHHTLLHKQLISDSTKSFFSLPTNNCSSSRTSSFVSSGRETQVLLATALVTIISDNGEEKIVRALIDQGSQSSFITESAVQLLRLKKTSITARVQGIGDIETSGIRAMVKFRIKSPGTGEVTQVDGFVMKRLTELLPCKTLHRHDWDHIRNLKLADPNFYRPSRIDVLLGADVFSKIVMPGLAKGPRGCPVAQETSLGWIVFGEVKAPTPSLCINNFHVVSELNETLKRFWEIEDVGKEGDNNLSEEEQQCENIFANTTCRLPNGRYQVELPLNQQNNGIQLGRSRHIAGCRLQSLEKSFNRNPNIREDYVARIEEYIENGYMEGAEKCENDQSCYLPHHCVLKETSSTTKLRVVFDASRPTSNGVSLNDILLRGPVVQDDLSSILMRWRKFPVALIADIKQMFLQIHVAPRHAELQRVVWRKSEEDPIEDFKLVTVTFGTKSAPYLATRVLRQLAIDEAQRYPTAAKVLLTDFYVDDMLSGTDSLEEARQLQTEMIQLMESGGFSLRKWNSNHSELLENLPPELVESNCTKSIDEVDECTRTLGVVWKPQSDAFTFSFKAESILLVWSKRTILSETAKVFDPLGWLSPFTIIGKMLIQKLWLSGMTWDEQVTGSLLTEWLNYKRAITDCADIQIERWLQYSSENRGLELHGFCDASSDAFAAAVYLRVPSHDGIKVRLIAAKTKVAPIKTVSLPRLELCGAVLLARLLKRVTISMKFSEHMPTFCWTDSEIVLAWLKAHPSKWKTFIANRVSFIHESVQGCIWRHVPTKLNAADCASRGIYPIDLKTHSLWWYGPDYLRDSFEHWPKMVEVQPVHLEIRKVAVHFCKEIEDTILESKFSSFTKLQRVTAYCLRFISNCGKRIESREVGYLKSEEIRKATEILIKRAQLRHFKSELNSLKSEKNIERSSKILKLYPFIDTNGIIRVGGRLRHADLDYNRKFPIILFDKDPFTQLYIDNIHRQTLHGGTQLMLNVISGTFWIVNARNSIKSHIHKCTVCFRYKMETRHQLMGNLPLHRLQICRPFTNTGLDYCGPFDLKTHKGRNPKKYKAYISLFVCMSTRAIHLELVTDYTSEGFIAAFRRFTSRRGLCREIFCDCGTNFVGASRTIEKQFHQMLDQSKPEIAEWLEAEGVKFNFNPPASPHFGGLWEAGVSSVKHHLKRIVGQHTLTYEEFNTLLCQIEACLNSRPLCPASSDPQDFDVLSPGHFLIGSALLTPPEPNLEEIKINQLGRWQFIQRLNQSFWKRWSTEYLSRLQQRPKWNHVERNLKIGDLVLVKDENLPPSRWLLGRIIDVHSGSDGLVRVATLKTTNNTLKRSITKLCLLPIENQN